MDFFTDKYKHFQEVIKEIKYKDITENLRLLEESNIQQVLDFINNEMRPKNCSIKRICY